MQKVQFASPRGLLAWASWRIRGGARPSGLPVPIPDVWWEWLVWAQWRMRGAPPPRPKVRKNVPEQWWQWKSQLERRLHILIKPHAEERSAFAGVGMFTAWDPRAALPLRGLLDWVAVTPDYGWCTPEIARELRAAFPAIHVWESGNERHRGQAAVDALGAFGYIGQAENLFELAASVAVRLNPTTPRALVSTVSFLPERSFWPIGWDCIAETYWNANPHATPERMHFEATKRGARHVNLCFGLYDAREEQPADGRLIPLRSYIKRTRERLPGQTIVGWSGYLAEHMLLADNMEALREARD